MNRKLRKILKDPIAFTRDMVGNRVTDVKRMLPRTQWQRSARRYSVVAAVYGVEKYLDDFFRSMVQQTIGFEARIQLIMVDDGSLDGSAEIIAAWQQKYPRSIRYVRKENGGQASARNVGLEYATGDWVTFVDPDDFVDPAYFERVERFLERRRTDDVALVSCNFLYFQEESGTISDSHPLRYRFRRGERTVRASELGSDIQLTVNSALFRRDLLRETDLRFDEGIRPNFEDGHFANRYLLAAGDRGVAFLPEAKYYYRRRADGTSTLDGAWSQPGRFGAVLERGYLDLLRASEDASPDGRAAPWVQRTVLYDLVWYTKRLVNDAEAVAFLSEEQRTRFKELFREVVSKIDESTILDFELAGTWLYHKIGFLGLWKGVKPSFQHAYVEQYDPIKKQVQLRYFYRGEPELEVFRIDGREVFPAFAKVRRHDFLGEEFVLERIVWLPVPDLSGRLSVALGSGPARILVRGKIHRESVALQDLARLKKAPELAKLPREVRWLHRLATTRLPSAMYRDAFLFMDRDTQADDNAEHLYRYVHVNRPDINAFFVLRRSSHDWARLEKEGFRLLAFGSLEHKIALIHAKHLISSHADRYVTSYPYEKGWDELRGDRRFTFLQHGVIKDDLSGWLNPKQIDCFVTSSAGEHASIVESGPYALTEREVVLTGLPRHDALGANAPSPQRLLVIMPTWRHSLMGPVKGVGNERELNPGFYESEYAQRWKSLLHSPELEALVERHGFRVQFFPHAYVQPYLEWFAPPAYVETASHRDRSMQDLFRSAAVMLTDYSSTAFEMAYLRKSVLYYQFDADLVFGGGHLTKKGYFDYGRDGFGPVCTDEASLLAALGGILARGGAPEPEHLARMERTFAYRDGRACERTLDAILALDAPTHPRDRSAQLLVEAARSATAHRAWPLAEERWARVLERPTNGRPPDAELRLVEALRESGKVDEGGALLEALASEGVAVDIDHERAKLATAAGDWPRAAALWARRASNVHEHADRVEALVRLAEAHRRNGAHVAARKALAEVPSHAASIAVRTEWAEIASAESRWDEAVERWEGLLEDRDGPAHALIRLAVALGRSGDHGRALDTAEEYLRRGDGRYEREARALRLALSSMMRDAVVDDRDHDTHVRLVHLVPGARTQASS